MMTRKSIDTILLSVGADIASLKLPAIGQQSPHNTHIFISQRHYRNIRIASRQQAMQPVFGSATFIFDISHNWAQFAYYREGDRWVTAFFKVVVA